MGAIVRERFGGPYCLVIKEAPEPEPKPGHAQEDIREAHRLMESNQAVGKDDAAT
jgi:hypothetical protein